MTSTTTRPQREKLARPASLWCSRWHHDKALRYNDGDFSPVGDFWGYTTFPSKDLCEQGAIEWIRKWACKVLETQGVTVTWLGAFPVDE